MASSGVLYQVFLVYAIFRYLRLLRVQGSSRLLRSGVTGFFHLFVFVYGIFSRRSAACTRLAAVAQIASHGPQGLSPRNCIPSSSDGESRPVRGTLTGSVIPRSSLEARPFLQVSLRGAKRAGGRRRSMSSVLVGTARSSSLSRFPSSDDVPRGVYLSGFTRGECDQCAVQGMGQCAGSGLGGSACLWRGGLPSLSLSFSSSSRSLQEDFLSHHVYVSHKGFFSKSGDSDFAEQGTSSHQILSQHLQSTPKIRRQNLAHATRPTSWVDPGVSQVDPDVSMVDPGVSQVDPDVSQVARTLFV